MLLPHKSTCKRRANSIIVIYPIIVTFMSWVKNIPVCFKQFKVRGRGFSKGKKKKNSSQCLFLQLLAVRKQNMGLRSQTKFPELPREQSRWHRCHTACWLLLPSLIDSSALPEDSAGRHRAIKPLSRSAVKIFRWTWKCSTVTSAFTEGV